MEALVSVHRSSELIVPDRPFSTLCNTSGHKMNIKRNTMCNTSGNKMQCSVWHRNVTFFGRDQNSEQLKRIETNFAVHSLLFVGRRREREILLRTSLIKHCTAAQC